MCTQTESNHAEDQVLSSFKLVAIEILDRIKPDSRLAVLDILRLPASVIRACRTNGIETDEAEIVEGFASFIFQSICH